MLYAQHADSVRHRHRILERLAQLLHSAFMLPRSECSCAVIIMRRDLRLRDSVILRLLRYFVGLRRQRDRKT